jgi:hypothetical protein
MYFLTPKKAPAPRARPRRRNTTPPTRRRRSSRIAATIAKSSRIAVAKKIGFREPNSSGSLVSSKAAKTGR